MEIVQEILKYLSSKEGEKFTFYFITLFGSFIMYIFSFQKGFEGSISVLKRLFPKRRKVFYDRMDFFLVVISGSFVGMILFQPVSDVQAFTAGLGWVGAINMVLRSQTDEAGDS